MTEPNKRLNVTLLTRSNCGPCVQAGELLDRLAVEYPLAITTFDVDQPEGAALAQQTGIVFVPGIVIGSDPVASGRVSEPRLRAEIARRLDYPLPSEFGGLKLDRWWLHRGSRLVDWLTRSW